MGIEEGRESEELGTRERILEAARELFIAEGYDGVSMRKISGKIEYSPTMRTSTTRTSSSAKSAMRIFAA